MASAPHQLFTAEEALARLGQSREQGCLLVHKGAELIQIYVRDGFVIRAEGGSKEGEAAVDHALHLADATYTWIRGVQPPDANKIVHLSILELTAKHGDITKPKMIQTSRLAGVPKKESESTFKYFLVPAERPTEKIYLTKVSTVLAGTKPPTCALITPTSPGGIASSTFSPAAPSYWTSTRPTGLS